MLKLDYSTDSDSDAEFQPLLRLVERKAIHASIEFIDNPDLLSHTSRQSPPPSPHSPAPPDLPTLHPCPCCGASQATFYCPDCITSSSPFYRAQLPCHQQGEGEVNFSQRQDKLFQSLERGPQLRDTIRPHLDSGAQRMRVYQELTRLEVKLRAQRQAIRTETERVQEGRTRLKQLAGRNGRREQQLEETSKQNFAEYIQECEERCSTSRGKLFRLSEELTHTRKLWLQEIQSDCFPIHKLHTSKPVPGSQSVQLPSPIPPSLSKQDYVWVEPGGESYSILDCCLPPASLYVPKFCLHQQREGAISSSMDSSRPVLSSQSEQARIDTLAALSYTAQLVRTIAFILDILLPDPISFSVFNIADTGIDCSEVSTIAAQLENNIVYLAASQGVPSDLLLKGHALENLLTLLNRRNPKLGQNGAFSPYPELSVREAQLLGKEADSPEEVTRRVSVGSETDSDWEDLEKSIALSEGLDLTESAQQSQEIGSRSRFLSLFWRSSDTDK